MRRLLRLFITLQAAYSCLQVEEEKKAGHNMTRLSAGG
jgi:hypothetical protein